MKTFDAQNLMRSSGVLLHLSSLPSQFGVGDMGSAAYRFADELVEARQSFWQILPLNPTDGIFGHSPYTSISVFAGNILLIAPDQLLIQGLIESSDLDGVSIPQGDFYQSLQWKEQLIRKAFRVYSDSEDQTQYEEFCEKNAYWLDDYALFVCIKQLRIQRPWNEWPEELKRKDAEEISKLNIAYGQEIQEVKFGQFIFFQQWSNLKAYANRSGIRIIGDLPMFLNLDGADAWSHPEILKLDEQFHPTQVAGTPPDYFSETGQRWGNPVYDWSSLAKENFQWWVDRVAYNRSLFDFLRLDHFVGLAQTWEIPAHHSTAKMGQWYFPPGQQLFDAIKASLGHVNFVAENLGTVTDLVEKLRSDNQIPGMKVLLFAFGGNPQDNPHQPAWVDRNTVYYLGTHDNNTALGWFLHDASSEEKRHLKLLIGDVEAPQVPSELIRVMMESDAGLVIIPLQDLLGCSSEDRMNRPGVKDGNWRWSFSWEQWTEQLKKQLAQLVIETKRI